MTWFRLHTTLFATAAALQKRREFVGLTQHWTWVHAEEGSELEHFGLMEGSQCIPPLPTQQWADPTLHKGVCPCCGDSSHWKVYDHPAGWNIAGFTHRQWVYLDCPVCSIQTSWDKKGVPREK